ncbi:MAG: hypothetical protein ACR2GA_04430 [Chloroflexota bacterium]
MKTRTLALAVTLSIGALGAGATMAPVSAQTLHQGKPYGCSINPNAAGCATTAPSNTSNGSPSATTNATSNNIAFSPPALPRTGGGAPATPALPFGELFGGAALLVLGAGLRRSRRHS